MKKFIEKILLSAVILFLCVLGINRLYVSAEAKCFSDIHKFKNVPEHIEICNTGSSHGYDDFCYDDIKEETFNFGLTSQSLIYDNRILKNYQDSLSDGTIVFIPVSYFTFYGMAEDLQPDFESKNQRYYRFLPKDLITDYKQKDAFYAKFPALKDYELLVKIIYRPTSYSQDLSWEKTTTAEHVAEIAPERAEGHVGAIVRDANGKLIINMEYCDALTDMIELCQRKGCRVILITTPFLHDYNDAVESSYPDFLSEHRQRIQTYVDKYHIEYYDYSHDERFSHSYNLFMDADHLNHAGARKFTDIVYREVVE